MYCVEFWVLRFEIDLLFFEVLKRGIVAAYDCEKEQKMNQRSNCAIADRAQHHR